MGKDGTSDWDEAYVNVDHIERGTEYPARWSAQAQAFREDLPSAQCRPGLPYGRHEREKVDLFLPEKTPTGVLIFVHGGYWRAFDRGMWSHLAAGPLARGWAVAIPGYPLVPEVRIRDITRSVTEAVIQIATVFEGPITLVGHSAGGHLVTRQIGQDTGLPDRVLDRISKVMTISGLHDLRPLLRLGLNADLRLDLDEASQESPALLWPRPGVKVHTWVGADERPEFLRQTALLANVWTGLRADMSQMVVPGRHHFDVIEALADADSDMVAALLD